MKLKIADIFDNHHLTSYCELIRRSILRNTCDWVYDIVTRSVTTKVHSDVFMKCFVINNNKSIIRDATDVTINDTF